MEGMSEPWRNALRSGGTLDKSSNLANLAALQLVFFAFVFSSKDFGFSPGECATEAREV